MHSEGSDAPTRSNVGRVKPAARMPAVPLSASRAATLERAASLEARVSLGRRAVASSCAPTSRTAERWSEPPTRAASTELDALLARVSRRTKLVTDFDNRTAMKS